MIEAVLFDLDGTLADTAPDLARTVNMMLASRGLAAVALEKVRPHVSQGARGMIMSAFAIGTGHPDFSAMRDEFLDLYAKNLCIDSRLFPGMDSLLAHLEGESIAWGVVTNKMERLARPLIEGLGLGQRAAVVVGGDTCARAGMPVVVAGYGYLGDGLPPAMWDADAILESVADLERWIRDMSPTSPERALP